MVIRVPKPSDVPALAELHLAAWQVAYRRILPDELLDNLSLDQARSRWNHLIKDKQRTTLVAEADGQTVGFIGYGASRDEDDSSNLVGEIYSIYVHPSRWGQGIGTALLRRATLELRDRGFLEETVWTLTDNFQARTFYKRNGFATDGAVKSNERRGVRFNEVRYRRKI